jgi:superfamily II DNA helicase RecQ
MARAGLVRLMDAVFEKDGKQIPYRKASLTRDARHAVEYGDEGQEIPLELTIRDAAPAAGRKAGKSRKRTAGKAAGGKRKKDVATRTDTRAEELLRAWRTTLAKKQGVPAFRIMSDRVLLEIAETRPKTAAELLAVHGIGIKAVEKFGAQIYRILNQVND